MEKTTKWDIDLPKRFIYDIEFITRYIKISGKEWLKSRIIMAISREKAMIIKKAEEMFISGKINDCQFKKITGFKPSEELKQLKKDESNLAKMGKLSAKRYLQDIAKRLKQENIIRE